MSDELEAVRLKSRDNVRIPFPWDDSPNGGFTDPNVKPWLKINDDYEQVNAETQESYPNSVLNYYRRLLFIRKTNPSLVSNPTRTPTFGVSC